MPTIDIRTKTEMFDLTYNAIESRNFFGIEELIKARFQHHLGDKTPDQQTEMIEDFIQFVRNRVAEIKIEGMYIPRSAIIAALYAGKMRGIPQFFIDLGWATFGGAWSSEPNTAAFINKLEVKPVKPIIKPVRKDSPRSSTGSESLPSTPRSTTPTDIPAAPSEEQPGLLRRIWNFILGVFTAIYNTVRSWFVPAEPSWTEAAPSRSEPVTTEEASSVNAAEQSIGSKVVGNLRRLFTPSRSSSQQQPPATTRAATNSSAPRVIF